MLNRRLFLAGASTALLAVAMPTSITAISPYDAAMELIEGRIRESLTRVGDMRLPPHEARIYAYWRTVTDMRSAIHAKLAEAYADPGMKDVKVVFGSIFEPSGRMHLSPQLILADSFAIMFDRCDRALFDAYGLFAPAHLV